MAGRDPGPKSWHRFGRDGGLGCRRKLTSWVTFFRIELSMGYFVALQHASSFALAEKEWRDVLVEKNIRYFNEIFEEKCVFPG
jgi:hypothetical protein